MKPSYAHNSARRGSASRHSLLYIELIEKAFVVVGIFILSGGLIPLLTTGGQVTDVFSPAYLVTLMLFYAGTLLFALPHLKRITAILYSITPMLFVLILYQFLQVTWLDNSLINIRGAVAAAMTSLFAIYVVSRFSTEEYFPLLLISFGIIIGLSIIFVQLFPSIAYQPHSWNWRGIFINRNALGTYAGMSALFFFIGVLSYRPHRILCAFMLIISMFVLYKTQSKTALMGLVGSIALTALMLWIYRLDISRRVLVMLCAAIATILFLMIYLIEPQFLLSQLGRGESFSGRSDAWQLILATIAEKPLVGHGTLRLNGELLAPHNMWLALWLKNGLIGLSIFIFFFSSNYARILIASSNSNWPARFLFPSIFSFMFIRGFTESLYFSTLLWALLVMAAASPMVRKTPQQVTAYVYTSIIIFILCISTIAFPISKALNNSVAVQGGYY